MFWLGSKAMTDPDPYRIDAMRNAVAQEKRVKRMAAFDQYDPKIRTLIHEYGFNSVKTLFDCGVTKPERIKHCIETVLDEFSPTRGSASFQGPYRGEGL
jgi:hypothetical protein